MLNCGSHNAGGREADAIVHDSNAGCKDFGLRVAKMSLCLSCSYAPSGSPGLSTWDRVHSGSLERVSGTDSLTTRTPDLHAPVQIGGIGMECKV